MRPGFAGRAAVSALVVLAGLGCGDSPSGPADAAVSDLSLPWEEVDPAAVGIDPVLLEDAVARAREVPRMMSLVVAKRGRLVLEEYFRGNHADSLNDVRSVTKSVLATLVARALQEGLLRDVDQTLGELLPPALATLAPWQREITVRHLLTMTGGFEWYEDGARGYLDWVRSPDPLRYLLDRPRAAAPGTTFEYNSAAVHLLGVVLEQAVGTSLDAFARRELFEPLGIVRVGWETLQGGAVNGASGLDLRPRDLARLGQLHLQDGRSGNARLLPRGWVEEATTPRFEWRDTFGPLREVAYGYLWWLEEAEALRAYCGWGYCGQYLFVVPDLELVAVATTECSGAYTELDVDVLEAEVLEVIVDYVLPAAGGAEALRASFRESRRSG